MANKKGDRIRIGTWVFLIGIVLAVVVGVLEGVIDNSEGMRVALVIIGLVVGFMNISDRNSKDFLIASVSLVIISSLGQDTLTVIALVNNVLSAILALIIPATIVVALRTALPLAKN